MLFSSLCSMSHCRELSYNSPAKQYGRLVYVVNLYVWEEGWNWWKASLSGLFQKISGTNALILPVYKMSEGLG